MIEYGDILSEPEEELEDGMVFRLNAGPSSEVPEVKEKKGDDPMWASSSSAPMDWFFADE